MLPHTDTFVHCHPEKKLVLLTTLRTGSSWCEANLREETGWLPKSRLSEGLPPPNGGPFERPQHDLLGLDALLQYHSEGYQFHCAIKEPYLRLTSAMDIVAPPLNPDLHVSSLAQQDAFANTIAMIVHKEGSKDLKNLGALNYTCGDAHMSWGTHITAMFLESLGIPCTPLVLDSPNLIQQNKPNKQNFSKFLTNLNEANPPDQVMGIDRGELRSIRFAAWLQICSKQHALWGVDVPSYSVYDWLGNDNYLYNTFMDLPHQEDRKQVAQNALLTVINDMWGKLNIEGIWRLKPYRQEYNRVYPWDTMFDLMALFIEHESDFPEFYDRNQVNNLFRGPGHYQFVVQDSEINKDNS